MTRRCTKKEPRKNAEITIRCPGQRRYIPTALSRDNFHKESGFIALVKFSQNYEGTSTKKVPE